MQAYVYNAALFCEECGTQQIQNLTEDRSELLSRPVDKEDSNEWPQGPYGDGGGESDTPNHCETCGVFLENPLTDDGNEYVRERYAWERDTAHPSQSRMAIETTQLWANYYGYLDLPGNSYVVWVGLAGQDAFAVGAALSFTVHGDLESARTKALEVAAGIQLGDVLELIDCNPD